MAARNHPRNGAVKEHLMRTFHVTADQEGPRQIQYHPEERQGGVR